MDYVIQPQEINIFGGRYTLVKPLPVRYTIETDGNLKFEYFRMINPLNEQNSGKLYNDVKTAAKEMLLSLTERLHDLLGLEKELKKKGETLPPLEEKKKKELSDFIQPAELMLVK